MVEPEPALPRHGERERMPLSHAQRTAFPPGNSPPSPRAPHGGYDARHRADALVLPPFHPGPRGMTAAPHPRPGVENGVRRIRQTPRQRNGQGADDSCAAGMNAHGRRQSERHPDRPARQPALRPPKKGWHFSSVLRILSSMRACASLNIHSGTVKMNYPFVFGHTLPRQCLPLSP